MIVEMRIEALETVTLPRGRDRAVVDPEPEKPLPSLREMHFRLKLDGSAPGYGTTTPSQYLTGSSVVPDSLITLQPGQSIRVMLRQALGDTKRLARPGTPLLHRALVHTYEGSRSVSDVISDNTIGLNGR